MCFHTMDKPLVMNVQQRGVAAVDADECRAEFPQQVVNVLALRLAFQPTAGPLWMINRLNS